MSALNNSKKEFLNGCHYATLATFNEDGSIHLTPVWYLFDNERFFVSTAFDRKARNIQARPEASIVVDSRRQGSEGWVSASATAEIIRGERSKAINAKIEQRYLTKAAIEDPRVGPLLMGEVTIGLTPRVWRAWDFKNFDDQFFAGILLQTPQQWYLPVD